MAKEDAVAVMKLPLEEGLLGQLLHSPDYNLFPSSVVFESNFIQVTKKGQWVGITNLPTIVAMGVTSSDPGLPLPNVLLMASHRTLARDLPRKDKARSSATSSLDLTRLLPLRSVRLLVHNAAQRILCLQTVTQKVYYLQLHQEHPNAVFALWARLARLLQNGLTPQTQHSMVVSSQAPSAERHAMMGRMGPKRTGVFSQLSGKERKRGEKGSRKVSFQGLPARNKKDLPVQGNASYVSSDVDALLSDMSQLEACAWCKRRLRGALPRSSREDRDAPLDVAFWSCLDGTRPGLWQEVTPSGLQTIY